MAERRLGRAQLPTARSVPIATSLNIPAMEFFEFVLVFSIVVVLPLTILKTVLEYKKSQAGTQVRGGADGVTAGDLKRLLRDAVEDANAPLLARIDDLEMAVLGEQADQLKIGEAFGDETDVEDQERTLGRRVSE